MKFRFLFQLILFTLFGTLTSCAQQNTGAKINWLTFEEAEKQFKANPKPILVDIYTDWCGWCKKMDKVTYSHPEVIKYINANYYPVKFDAESKEKIALFGKTFENNGVAVGPRKPPHDLASFLLSGKMSYPSTVFIKMNNGTISPEPVPGYLDVPTMEMILKYISDTKNQTVPFADYQQSFQAAWQ